MVFNIDLSTVKALENHRGIGYLLFLSSIVAPSFVAYALIEPAMVHRSLLSVAAIAAAVGLLSTSVCILGSFLILFEGPRKNGGIESAGTRSLVLGMTLSLTSQCLALAYALLTSGPHSFDSYARTALLFVGATVAFFFVGSFSKSQPPQNDRTDGVK